MTDMGKRWDRPLDDTWRLVQRGVPQDIGPTVDGRDCYVFQRAGGERPTDNFSTHVVPVETFWRGAPSEPTNALDILIELIKTVAPLRPGFRF